MSLQRLVINTAALTADQFSSVCNLAPLKTVAANNLSAFFAGLCGGNYSAATTVLVGAVQAAGTMTVAAGGSANDETCVVCGVTFTAKTSGATGNQFDISATAATQAANMATAFNASASLAGIVTAVAVLGVVTLTAVVPGTIGNGLVMSDALANVTTVTFAAGSDGTSYSIDLA